MYVQSPNTVQRITGNPFAAAGAADRAAWAD